MRRISPAVAVSVVALILALTGGAVAATQITGSQIADSTITGKDVKNKSLTRNDFLGSVRGPRGLRGPQGPQGPQGAQGAQGPPGPTVVGQLTIVASAQVPYGTDDPVQSAIAFCPSGQRAVSGGGANIADEQLAATSPTSNRSGWYVIGVDLSHSGTEYVQAEAVCAPTGQAVAARLTRTQVRTKIARVATRIAAQYEAR